MLKKGLSDIVSTLLMVLFGTIAVVLLWGVVNNFLLSSEDQIKLQLQNADFEIKNVDLIQNQMTISVNRKIGEGSVSGLAFVFENSTESETVNRETNLEALDVSSFDFLQSEIEVPFGTLVKISLIPIYNISGEDNFGSVVDEYLFEDLEIAEAFCGDGVINQGSEECDGDDLGGETCVTLGHREGVRPLDCSASCTFDVRGCVISFGER